MRAPTQRDYERLASIAEAIAATPPVRRTHQAHNAVIPWDLIIDLRRELERASIDWRRAKAEAAAERGTVYR